jgi:hypothetical protein
MLKVGATPPLGYLLEVTGIGRTRPWMTAEGSPEGGVGERSEGQGGDLDVQIDAVEQWAREAGQVADALGGGAGTARE